MRQRRDSSATRENDMAPHEQTPEDEALRFNLGRAVLLLENALGRVPRDLAEPADAALNGELQEALDSLHQALRTPRAGDVPDLEDSLAAVAARQGLREPARSEEGVGEDGVDVHAGDMAPWQHAVESFNRIHIDLRDLRDDLSSHLRWTMASIAGAFILLGTILITGLLLLAEHIRAVEEAVRALAN